MSSEQARLVDAERPFSERVRFKRDDSQLCVDGKFVILGTPRGPAATLVITGPNSLVIVRNPDNPPPQRKNQNPDGIGRLVRVMSKRNNRLYVGDYQVIFNGTSGDQADISIASVHPIELSRLSVGVDSKEYLKQILRK